MWKTPFFLANRLPRGSIAVRYLNPFRNLPRQSMVAFLDFPGTTRLYGGFYRWSNSCFRQGLAEWSNGHNGQICNILPSLPNGGFWRTTLPPVRKTLGKSCSSVSLRAVRMKLSFDVVPFVEPSVTNIQSVNIFGIFCNIC